MNYSFHPSAKAELNEAVTYYEACRIGLGTEFLEEIYSTIQRITQFPKAWNQLSLNTRRCLLKRFPYGIIYQINESEITIIAVMQMNRKPDYWKGRIQ
jgi:plasmid stabilization system protein ParE